MNTLSTALPKFTSFDNNTTKWKIIAEHFATIKSNHLPILAILASSAFSCSLKQSIEELFNEHYNLSHKNMGKYGQLMEIEKIISTFISHEALLNWCLKTVHFVIENLIMKKVDKSNKSVANLSKWVDLNPLKWTINIIGNITHLKKSKRFFDKMITFSQQFLHEYYFKKNVKFLFDLSAKNDETLQSLEKCVLRMEDAQTLPILMQAITEDLLTVCVGTMELINIFSHLSNIISHQWKQKCLFNEISGPIKKRSKTDLMSCLVRKVSTDQDLLDLSESAHDEKEAKEMQDEIDFEDRPLKELDNSRFGHNILSSILHVYATPLEFIEEYCSQMTIRLLKMNSAESLKYENDQIELLKRYFGPVVTQKCAIMMDDLKKSAEINNYIYNKSSIFSNSAIEFEVQLLTPLIWDVTEEGNEGGSDPCRLPHNITRLMERFIEEYSNLKKLRELQWLNQYSMAEVEITFKNTTHNVWLSAINAIIIHQLSNDNALTVEQLSEILSSSYDKIKSGLTVLMKEGLITTNNGQEYKLVDEYEHEKATSKMNNDEIYDDELNKQNDGKTQDGMENEIWSFIEGMLTNLGAMSIDKMYSSLKMFAFGLKDPPFSVDQLKDYLQAKVKEGILIFEHNNYIIRK